MALDNGVAVCAVQVVVVPGGQSKTSSVKGAPHMQCCM